MSIRLAAALLASASVLLAGTAYAAAPPGTIIAPTAATINAGGPGFGPITNTIDQSGLSSTYVSGVTNFNSYIASNPTHSLIFSGNEWFSNQGTTSAQVTYDFGSVVTITALALWNEDASGIGKLKLSAAGYGTFLNVSPFDGPINVDYPAQVFTFSAVTTQFVTFDMSKCPQPNGTGFLACAIGEVAFQVGNVVPEPATWALMISGFGLAGLALRTRRRVLA